jgi:hypothetical protein
MGQMNFGQHPKQDCVAACNLHSNYSETTAYVEQWWNQEKISGGTLYNCDNPVELMANSAAPPQNKNYRKLAALLYDLNLALNAWCIAWESSIVRRRGTVNLKALRGLWEEQRGPTLHYDAPRLALLHFAREETQVLQV